MKPSSVVSIESHAAQTGEHPAEDHIHVFLENCRVELFVGLNPQEKLRPQPVIVSVEVEAALPHHYQDLAENSIDRVINYEKFYNFIREELPKLGHIPLLETLAEQIINRCFEDRRIRKVRVRLEKPEVYAGTARAGITVCRSRHD